MKPWKALRLLGGNLLVLLVLLLLVELALRLLDLGYGSHPWEPDPVFHHAHPRNYCYRSYTPTGDYGGFQVCFNALGKIEDPEGYVPQPGAPTVVLLGDSFVEALEVPWDSSTAGRLRARFPEVNVLNYAHSSYSPMLYYLMARKFIFEQELKPDLVFLCLFSNDVRNDSTYLRDAVFDTEGELLAVSGAPASPLRFLVRRSYLGRNLRRAHLTLVYWWNRPDLPEDGPQPVVRGVLEEFPGWEGTLSAHWLERTVEVLRQGGAEVVLSAVPSKFHHVRGPSGREEFSHKVERWAAARSIPFVDLTEPFRRWKETHPRESLFFPKDIHWNERGHGVVSAVWGDYLEAWMGRAASKARSTQ